MYSLVIIEKVHRKLRVFIIQQRKPLVILNQRPTIKIIRCFKFSIYNRRIPSYSCTTIHIHRHTRICLLRIDNLKNSTIIQILYLPNLYIFTIRRSQFFCGNILFFVIGSFQCHIQRRIVRRTGPPNTILFTALWSNPHICRNSPIYRIALIHNIIQWDKLDTILRSCCQ